MRQLAPYDYAALDADTAVWLQGAASRIHGHMRRTVEEAAAIGAELLEAKARLPYGSFMGWVENVLSMKYSTAQNFMQLAVLCRQNSEYFRFTPSVVYELAEPKTPEAVRRAVLAGDVAPTVNGVRAARKAAKAGEPITGASGAARSQRSRQTPASIADRLVELLLRDDADALSVDELVYLLADCDEPGDAAYIRTTAVRWADALVEAADRAEAEPPTELDEDEDEDEDDA